MPKRFIRILIVVVITLALVSGGLFALEVAHLRRARIPWSQIPTTALKRMIRDIANPSDLWHWHSN